MSLRWSVFALLVLLAFFGVLQLFGIQPGEDNNRWLLYLFISAWPLVSLAVCVAAIRVVNVRRRVAAAALLVAVSSLAGFIAWGRLYAGLW
jgi:hypothetical protein